VPPIRDSCLVAALGPFGAELAARNAAQAVAGALRPAEADVLALDSAESMPAQERFDERMLASRALVLVQDRLTPELLAGSLTEELATRARQSGVPAYAIVRERKIDDFGARVLDLQVILEAQDERGLRKAARELAKLI
jgi:hypothetical protein